MNKLESKLTDTVLKCSERTGLSIDDIFVKIARNMAHICGNNNDISDDEVLSRLIEYTEKL